VFHAPCEKEGGNKMAFTAGKAGISEEIRPEVYRALEGVVGPDYVTNEPAILDGYCFGWGGEKFSVRPLAAITPASTEEVQAIVKVCARHKIKFKAHSTGFSMGNMSPLVAVDLRRMNQILEIDEKNMIAIIEPYCSFGAVMNAVIEKGLRVYQIGAGPSASPLANSTSTWGYGTVNCSAGWGGRVSLAVEWVLPTGEILRTGSLGAVGEWFTGDGPGISIKGAMRGAVGHMGGMGVFTKVALKLVPWYGPPKIESFGEPPNYTVKIPDSIKSITMVFPSQDDYYEAMRYFQEEGIVYWCSRRGAFSMAAATTGTNAEVLEKYNSGEFQKKLAKLDNNLSIGIDASSPREMAFKEKIVQTVVEKLGAEILDENIHEMTARFVHGFNGLGAVKGTFRSTGGMGSSPFTEETLDLIKMVQNKTVALKNEYSSKGIFLDDGDSTWVTLLEDFGGHNETPIRYDPAEAESNAAAEEYDVRSNNQLAECAGGIPQFETGTGSPGMLTLEELGEKVMNVHLWVNKIRQAFDPYGAGEGFGGLYVKDDEE
jgi:glycolate oxidase